MEITITTDQGIILQELIIDEALEEKESGRTGEDLALAVAHCIEINFETK